MTGTIPADLLRQAMDAAHITDNPTRAGIAAVCMGESDMQGYTEEGYAHTRNARIREVFGSRVAGLSDADLDTAKADDRRFFNLVYGGEWGARNLGNTQPGDGYEFRGRGLIQLTGRSNYERYSGRIGHPEIVENPDLANRPDLAALLAVAYIADRYKGGGFVRLVNSVGNNTPDVLAAKQNYYRHFLTDGTFDATPPAGAAG